MCALADWAVAVWRMIPHLLIGVIVQFSVCLCSLLNVAFVFRTLYRGMTLKVASFTQRLVQHHTWWKCASCLMERGC